MSGSINLTVALYPKPFLASYMIQYLLNVLLVLWSRLLAVQKPIIGSQIKNDLGRNQVYSRAGTLEDRRRILSLKLHLQDLRDTKGFQGEGKGGALDKGQEGWVLNGVLVIQVCISCFLLFQNVAVHLTSWS